MSLKYGIEIDTADSERLDVIKLFLNSLQIAAEEIVFCDFAICVRLPHRLAAPIGAQNSLLGHARFLFARASESVGKNLIDNRAFYIFGRFEIL